MTYGDEGYISVISTAYCYPITALLEKLEKLQPSPPNPVQTSAPDNGYSAAIIVLTVLLLESVIGRTQFVQDGSHQQKNNAPVDYVSTEFPDSGVADRIKELFVVRNVIAHNHLWEAQVQWDDDQGLIFVDGPERRTGHSNKNFTEVVDNTTRKTRLLSLNVFPTRIHRRDAVVALQTAVDFLEFLEEQDRHYVSISTEAVRFNGKIIPFVELVKGLKV